MKDRSRQLLGSDRQEKQGSSRPGTRGPDTPLSAARWEIRLAWLFRALILLTAVAHAVQGALLYVLLCLAAIALVVVPAWIARSSAANLPVEIAPGATTQFFGWVMHVDLSSLSRHITWGSFFGGMVCYSTVLAVLAWASAWAYNRLAPGPTA